MDFHQSPVSNYICSGKLHYVTEASVCVKSKTICTKNNKGHLCRRNLVRVMDIETRMMKVLDARGTILEMVVRGIPQIKNCIVKWKVIRIM